MAGMIRLIAQQEVKYFATFYGPLSGWLCVCVRV